MQKKFLIGVIITLMVLSCGCKKDASELDYKVGDSEVRMSIAGYSISDVGGCFSVTDDKESLCAIGQVLDMSYDDFVKSSVPIGESLLKQTEDESVWQLGESFHYARRVGSFTLYLTNSDVTLLVKLARKLDATC